LKKLFPYPAYFPKVENQRRRRKMMETVKTVVLSITVGGGIGFIGTASVVLLFLPR